MVKAAGWGNKLVTNTLKKNIEKIICSQYIYLFTFFFSIQTSDSRPIVISGSCPTREISQFLYTYGTEPPHSGSNVVVFV